MDKVRKKGSKPPERLDETNTNILRKKTGGENPPRPGPKPPSQ
jgi:hypothetical protein